MTKGIVIIDNAPRDYISCLSVAERMNQLGHACYILPWSTPHSFLLELCKEESIRWILFGQYRRQFASLYCGLYRLNVKVFVHEFEGYPYSVVLDKWLNDITEETGSFLTRFFCWGSQQRNMLLDTGVLRPEQILVSGSIRHQRYRTIGLQKPSIQTSPISKLSNTRVLICFSSNVPTPKMQSRTNEFKMYCELVGVTRSLDNYEIQLLNREHLLSVASILKNHYGIRVVLRPHPFCNVADFTALAENYDIPITDIHSPDSYTMYDELLQCELVVTMGSTSILEASSLNIPVVNIQTISKCESARLSRFYYSTDFAGFCINATSVPGAVRHCLSILNRELHDPEPRPSPIDNMFDSTSDSLGIVCSDIFQNCDNLPSSDSPRAFNSLFISNSFRLDSGSEPPHLGLNSSRYLSRYYLHKYRKQFSDNSFSPSIFWIGIPDQNSAVPVIECIQLL